MAKEVEVKKISKKALIKEIAELTGKKAFEFDSLGRSNIATIEWVLELVKKRLALFPKSVDKASAPCYNGEPTSQIRLNQSWGKAVDKPPPCKALCGG